MPRGQELVFHAQSTLLGTPAQPIHELCHELFCLLIFSVYARNSPYLCFAEVLHSDKHLALFVYGSRDQSVFVAVLIDAITRNGASAPPQTNHVPPPSGWRDEDIRSSETSNASGDDKKSYTEDQRQGVLRCPLTP